MWNRQERERKNSIGELPGRESLEGHLPNSSEDEEFINISQNEEVSQVEEIWERTASR